MPFAQSLHIDRNRSQPLYRQIAEQIRVQIGEGQLPPGTQLPTVRQLAEMLGITRVTAQNAYGELQSSGWIESTVGRGTFVTASAQNDDLLAALGRRITPDSVMSQMQSITKIAGLRSFAYAEPDPRLFPVEDFWNSVNNQADVFVELMGYGSSQGDDLLRVELGAMLTEQGIYATPNDVMVTSGVSQGISLAIQCLAAAGSYVIVEQPVYLGMLHVLTTSGVQPIGVPLDSGGLRLDILEQMIKKYQPRFLYTVLSFQNPTGICVSTKRREELLALAARYNLPIIEDDVYGQLAFTEEHPVPLKALDKHGLVFYVSGFSKMLMPGLRMGYIVPPPHYLERLVSLRQALDLSQGLFEQRALANFLHRGRLKIHLRRVLPHYRERRDEMMRALRQIMPGDVHWTHPEGGFCTWVTLPHRHRNSDLYHSALEHGVAFTPGEVFLIEPDDALHLRLCFGRQTPEVIRDGIEILGRLLRTDSRAYQFRRIMPELPIV
jgi:DNA-binding transcriptional MocR family regulator